MLNNILRVHCCQLSQLPRAFVGLVLLCLLVLLLLLVLCLHLLKMPAVLGNLLLVILLLLLLALPLYPLLQLLVPLVLLPPPLENKFALLLGNVELLGAVRPSEILGRGQGGDEQRREQVLTLDR